MSFGGSSISSKKRTKTSQLWFHGSKVEFDRSFLGGNVGSKNSFWLFLTFRKIIFQTKKVNLNSNSEITTPFNYWILKISCKIEKIKTKNRLFNVLFWKLKIKGNNGLLNITNVPPGTTGYFLTSSACSLKCLLWSLQKWRKDCLLQEMQSWSLLRVQDCERPI